MVQRKQKKERKERRGKVKKNNTTKSEEVQKEIYESKEAQQD